jgi:hypothetical protein
MIEKRQTPYLRKYVGTIGVVQTLAGITLSVLGFIGESPLGVIGAILALCGVVSIIVSFRIPGR